MDTTLVHFAEKYPLLVHTHRARQPNFSFDQWEKNYLTALLGSLNPGDVVFDVGAEEFEFTALVAKIVGASNVHAAEPAAQVWPNGKALWEANGLGLPGGTFRGFISDKPRGLPIVNLNAWPAEATGPIALQGGFCVENERFDIPVLTVDQYCVTANIKPNVLMIDVEGCEARVLRGAVKTLSDCKPAVFLELHNDGLLAHYGTTKQELFDFMASVGYKGVLLPHDHSEHWKWTGLFPEVANARHP
jgi:FkbM family methyltransferase